MAINHYQLLGIPEDSDVKRIKAAYRSMAKRFHPDTNKGSEAAADLFRKLNEAYRILSDERLRAAYDKTIVRKQSPQPPKSKIAQTSKTDPQQKFNRFLNSLLDAIFEAPDLPDEEPLKKAAPARRPQSARKPKRRPDFNFYYSLAMEQSKSAYHCDEDGIYRKSDHKGRRQRYTVPGTTLLLFLISGLWELLKH